MATSATDDFHRAEQAAQFILERASLRPRIGVVLGSGLGAVAAGLADAVRIPSEDIPHFPKSTAEGHAGVLVLGRLDNIPVAVMQGRAHLYEGYSPSQIVLPVRALERMGVRAMVLTNAAGGIRPEYSRGALVVLRDHINLQGANPLIGLNDERLAGSREKGSALALLERPGARLSARRRFGPRSRGGRARRRRPRRIADSLGTGRFRAVPAKTGHPGVSKRELKIKCPCSVRFSRLL